MKNIIIHVGLRKTGSTFLQQHIFPHIEHCDYVGPPFTYQNPFFNALQYADESLQIEDNTIENILSLKNSNLLISSEEFCGSFKYAGCINRTPIANRLKKYFPDAKIILFLRGQYESILSHYYQYVRSNLSKGTIPINQFIQNSSNRTNLKNEPNSEHKQSNLYLEKKMGIHLDTFKYYELIKCYKALFENVGVFLYEDLLHHPQETIKEIEEFSKVKMSESKVDFSKKINSTESIAELVALRKRNQLNTLLENKFSLDLFQKIIQTFKVGTKKERLDRLELKSNITNYFKDNNQQVLYEFGVSMDKYPHEYSI